MKPIVISLILILPASTFTFCQTPYKYSRPIILSDGWKINNIQSLNVDTLLIYKLFEKLQNKEHKIHSILLVKNNHIIIEEYFGNYSVFKQQDLRSVTKSITSILMGIAIDKGFIDNIDEPISNYFNQIAPNKNFDERKERITIRHLLTMSTGLDCNDWDSKSDGQEDKIYKKKDWLQYFLDLPMINEPGAKSDYCTMGQVLAAEIISQTSGMSLEKFAETHLFSPMNITNVSWGHTSKKNVRPSAKRLYMTPRDMAKIGQLIINKGKWQEKKIVSEEWIEESTNVKTQISGIDYGYLWWNIPFNINKKMISSISATGNGGQYIFILPEKELITVFTGGAYNSQDDKIPFAIMKDIFLPTFIND